MSPADLFATYQGWAATFAKAYADNLPAWVTQDELQAAALVGIWRASLSWSPAKPAAFLTHARLCVKREIIDYLRTNYRKRRQRLRFMQLDKPAWRRISSDPSKNISGLEEVENREQVEVLLQKLPLPAQELLSLRYLQGQTTYQIAIALGKCQSEVVRKIERYRNMARKVA